MSDPVYVAAPNYKCQVCGHKMPLTDIKKPVDFDYTLLSMYCHGCKSNMRLKVRMVPKTATCTIQVVLFEPGLKAKRILEKRGRELTNSVEKALN